MEIQDSIASLRAGGKVKRCHTLQTITTQTVAEHSWGVAILLQKFFPESSKQLLLAALSHDIAEVLTGDIPADAKWMFKDLKNITEMIERQYNEQLGIDYHLTDEEKHILKLCDLLELLLFCVEEIFMGNKNMIPIAHKLIKVMDEMKMPSKEFNMYYTLISGKFQDASK